MSAVFAQDLAGSLEAKFDPHAGFNGAVRAVALRSDGKLIVGGAFGSFDGTVRQKLAVLNDDGSLDPTFDPGNGPDAGVNTLLATASNQVFVGGDFGTFNADDHNGIVLLDAAGTPNDSFNANLANANAGLNPPGFVTSIVPTTDRQFILTGLFVRVDNALASGVARVDSGGVLDNAYQPNSGPNGKVNAAVILPDGRMLIGGEFTAVDNVPRRGLAILNPDGQLDTAYDPGSGVQGVVLTMAAQADGAILLGGDFAAVGGQTHASVARVKMDGSVDSVFQATADGQVRAIVPQNNGKILLGGAFGVIDGVPRNGLARLNADGSLDTTFDPGSGADAPVNTIALQTDSLAVIGGEFTTFNATPRNRIARVNVGVSPVSAASAVSLQANVTLIGRGTTNTAKITIQRNGDLTKELKVNYTVGGNAVSGVDYRPLKGAKKIKAGASQASIKIVWLGGDFPAGRVKAKVKILPGTDYTVAEPAKVKIKIDR